MRFGMILLLLVIACSFAGSMIPQERTAMEYVQRYGAQAAQIILLLRLNDVFSAPYFIVLMAALCVNLTLCSVVRLPKTMRAGAALMRGAASAAADKPLTVRQADRLRAYLKAHRYREVSSAVSATDATTEQSATPFGDGIGTAGGARVYAKNMAGFYGSFLTHLSILLVLAVGSATVMLANVHDQTVMPGETIALADGTLLTVESFQIENDLGELDYASVLTATSADGAKTQRAQIRVNEPMRFGEYKIYQQTYGTAGSVLVTNLLNGASDKLLLTESCLLSLDGVNGLFYSALYPGFIEGADGTVTLITSTSGAYTDPVYDVRTVVDGDVTAVLAFPGETLTVGDVSFTMGDPTAYPGLRIKRMPGVVLGALYAVFVLMVASLYLCFFVPPVCVMVTDEGFALRSPKTQTGLLLEIDALLEEES